jgi:hypothetical protein
VGFEVEGPTNLVFIGSFWFRVFWVEATSNFNVVGRKSLTIFKDFANHEAIRISKNSQSLQTNTQCDHNVRNKYCQKVKSLARQS